IQGTIAAGTIGPDPLAAGAVRTEKNADKAGTLSKIADGVLPPAIGVAVSTGVQKGQNIPVPAGFARSGGIFFAALKFINVDPNGGVYNCFADNTGKVTASPNDRVVAVGVALAKKGGW